MLSVLRYRLRAIFRRGAVERELDDELRFHLERHVEMEMRAGLSRAEAERRARLLFGGVEQVKEASREGRGVSWLEIFGRDLRYAARLLAKSPGFTFVALASLTLGIGANTAMFQLLNAVVLAPLPVERPGELVEVRVREADLDAARGSFRNWPSVTNGLWERIREQQEPFTATFAWSAARFNLAPAGDIRLAEGLWVSGSFFSALGVSPALGRLFSPADDRRGCGLPGVVIGHDFWQREFGGDASVIGRAIAVDTHRVEIIGVAPAGFFGVEVGRAFDVALPICAAEAMSRGENPLENGTLWWLKVMGRLRPGWTPARADAHIAAASRSIFGATLPSNYPSGNVARYLASTLYALPAGRGISDVRNTYSGPLRLLLAMTGLVLLIACANLTNLMLTRGALRGRELTLRLALGASRARLLSQLLTESLLIAVLSAAAGMALARLLCHVLIALFSTPRNPIALALTTDWYVLAFTSGTAALTCLLLGLAPALRATRGSPADVLSAGSRGATTGRDSLILRRVLMAVQVAVSLVLVAGALLFVRSFRNLTAVSLGFETQGVLVVDAEAPAPASSVRGAQTTRDRLLTRMRALPGVEGAALTNLIPLAGISYTANVWMDDGDRARATSAHFSSISPGYFQTLRVPLLAGRDFDAHDAAHDFARAIVNESFARTIAGGGNAVGRRFRIAASSRQPERVSEIIGVVGDTRYAQLRESFIPIAYTVLSSSKTDAIGGTLLVRTALPPDAAASAIREALREVEPAMRFRFRELDAYIRQTLVRERALALLAGLFGLLAAFLAAIGLHGVIAYTVESRRREIGIRLALGATRGRVVSSVMGESGRWVAIGLAVGVPASYAAARMAQTLFFGLEPGDPATLAAAAAGLAVVALTAAWLPARRAARVDPIATLKEE